MYQHIKFLLRQREESHQNWCRITGRAINIIHDKFTVNSRVLYR